MAQAATDCRPGESWCAAQLEYAHCKAVSSAHPQTSTNFDAFVMPDRYAPDDTLRKFLKINITVREGFEPSVLAQVLVQVRRFRLRFPY